MTYTRRDQLPQSESEVGSPADRYGKRPPFSAGEFEAIATFPRRVNVAVATSLATTGPEITDVTMHSVPNWVGDDHRITEEIDGVKAVVDIYSSTSRRLRAGAKGAAAQPRNRAGRFLLMGGQAHVSHRRGRHKASLPDSSAKSAASEQYSRLFCSATCERQTVDHPPHRRTQTRCCSRIPRASVGPSSTFAYVIRYIGMCCSLYSEALSPTSISFFARQIEHPRAGHPLT